MSDCPACGATLSGPSVPTACPHCRASLVSTDETIVERDADRKRPLAEDRGRADTHTEVPLPSEDTAATLEMSSGGEADRGAGEAGSDSGGTTRLAIRRKRVVEGGGGGSGADYQVEDQLGEGGMGVVYLAQQNSTRRQIALKRIKGASDRSDADRFLREAIITAGLEHPNIVPVHDLGIDAEGRFFFVMKRVRGIAWDKVIGDRSEADNLDVLLKVCDGVAFAHSRGIVHRDLKPENVMLGDFGEVLVMDWGLALSADGEESYLGTGAGPTMGGTPAYMAPEMARGDLEGIGPHSDIYLLGGILFEIVTGKRPHGGDSVTECMALARENRIQDVAMTGELIAIARRAMAEDPAERFPSVPDFQAAVRDYRKHSESLRLTRRAVADLAIARRREDYDRYQAVLFAFREAQNWWADNQQAADGEVAARAAFAGLAIRRGDYDLAESLVEGSPLEGGMLDEEIRRGRAARVSRERRVRHFSRAIKALLALIFALLVLGVYQISKEKRLVEDALTQAQQARHESLVANRQVDAIERRVAEDELREWRTVMDDHFTDDDLLHWFGRLRYQSPVGRLTRERFDDFVEVVDQGLRVQGPEEDMLLLFHDQPVLGDVRMSYEVTWLGGSDGSFHAVLRGNNWDDGYIFQLGGWENSLAAIQRGHGGGRVETLAQREWAAQEGRRYQIEVSAVGGKLTLVVDGETLLTATDPEPLISTDEGRFCGIMSNWDGISILHELRIDELGQSKKIDLLALAERLLARGVLIAARELFEEELRAERSPERIARAQAGFERARHLLNKDRHNMRIRRAWPDLDVALEAGSEGLELDLTDQPISSLEPLRGIPIASLWLGGTPVRDLSPLADMPLVHLDLSRTEVDDLSPLTGNRSLRELRLAATVIDDLSPVREAPIATLDISTTRLADHSLLAELPLRVLRADDAGLADLSPLRNQTELERAALNDNGIVDLRPLVGCVNLRWLSLNNNPLGDCSPLGSMALDDLSVAGCGLETLSGLAGSPLRFLHCGDNPLRTLDGLSGLQLKGFFAPGTLLRELEGLPIAQLRSLDISRTPVEDLLALSGADLSHLTLRDCPAVVDLTPLAAADLRELDLSGTGVSDLRPLMGSSLRSLSAADCHRLRDVSPLADLPLRTLDLGGCTAIVDLDPLRGLSLDRFIMPVLERYQDLAWCREMPWPRVGFSALELLPGTPPIDAQRYVSLRAAVRLQAACADPMATQARLLYTGALIDGPAVPAWVYELPIDDLLRIGEADLAHRLLAVAQDHQEGLAGDVRWMLQRCMVALEADRPLPDLSTVRRTLAALGDPWPAPLFALLAAEGDNAAGRERLTTMMQDVRQRPGRSDRIEAHYLQALIAWRRGNRTAARVGLARVVDMLPPLHDLVPRVTRHQLALELE